MGRAHCYSNSQFPAQLSPLHPMKDKRGQLGPLKLNLKSKTIEEQDPLCSVTVNRPGPSPLFFY